MLCWRPLLLFLTMVFCCACVSGPVPGRAPKDVRLSIRHLNKGSAYFNKGCYPKAMQLFQKAHERFAASDNLRGTAESLNSMANTYYRLGDYQSALALYDDAIGFFRQLGDSPGLVRALANKSATLIADHKPDEAAAILDEADNASGNRNILAALRLKTRALLLIARGDVESAQTHLNKALETAPQTEHALLADIRYTMGHLVFSLKDPEQAVGHFEAALAIDRQQGAYYSTGMDLAALGSCFEDMAQHARAAGYFERSLKIFALLGASDKVRWTLAGLTRNAGKAGLDTQSALHWVDQWLGGQKETDICR